MSNWLDSAEDAVKGAFCSYLSNVDRYFSFWSELGIPTDQVNSQLRTYVCDQDGPTEPPPPPFTGGQCETTYRVKNLTIRNDGTTFVPNGTAVPGPVTGVTINSRTPAPITGSPNRTQFSVTWSGPNFTLNQSPISFQDQISFQVDRQDGLPDDCGDIPPDIPPVQPVTQPISFTYIDASDNSVNVNAELTIFAPIFAPIGIFAPIIRVPIRIAGPNFDFSGNLNLPDLNIDIYPSFARPSTGVPDPEPDVDPDSPDNPATPDDGSTRELVGLLVRSQISSETRTTEILQPTGPNLYVPRIANAYFRVRLGDRLSWLGPFDVKTTNTFVPVPPDVVAVSGRVDAEQGWTSTGTMVFRSSEPDNS